VLALLISLVVLETPTEQRVLPVQADLSAVAGLGERSAAGVAVYVGAAAGLARTWGNPFAGLGFELVHAAGFTPFRASYGVQFRAGYAWTRKDLRPKELMPDVGFGDLGLPAGVIYPRGPDGVRGVRVGLGLTAPWWTGTLLFHRLFADEKGGLGQFLNVAVTLLLAPFSLMNHLEVVGELVGLKDASTVTVRLGCGF
jgi:hypothetical protein